ncbi:hypothetical protein [Gymnodinialimonas sp. 57CJ19]|uniref:hypothetical protein n=1 Tax=Gymnodinialimonas sp. 57CJ19 TaxID=3138498 RepID=UPI0031343027
MKLSKTLMAACLILSAQAVVADTLPMSWTPPSGMTPGPIEGTEAILVTGPEGAAMQIVTEGIAPGHAITVWFVAVQNPHLCQSNPCTPMEAMGMPEMNAVAVNGGGTVVPEDGEIRVSAFLPAGEVPTNMFETRFTEPEMSEYHLVVHDHGPLAPDLASDMLSSFRGGCTLESVPPFYPESARSDGEGGGNTCVSRQVALFVPSHLRSN